ncbi:DUF4349 domain-containing protein [Scytonema sp. UIC 10036]|uniref:DUF4349 domain-containing protein n=1 Tax=Scytonema sp. UIC 10036 TaxID=2304196 RepID=UPI0012DA057B|nr:DUF4349 domain-containing protein [Scytonema sp. UIC 10036]MUG99533.1 DUF4349 domain-containing protein [Scytonema sp. UIC 10036]
MNNSLYKPIRKPILILSVLAGGIIFTGCASAPQMSGGAPPGNAPLQEEAPANEVSTDSSATAQAAQVPSSRPQLIKKASMTIVVDSVGKSLETVSQLIDKQQGDLIGLEEQQPRVGYTRHRATIQMRVPQNSLELTLDELAKLGTVENRTITAEDVGNQIVDIQARLNNLRKTETNLQKIMDKAGSVRDVLSVAKELNNVRESIERIDAQLKNLQNQVAYSTITLNLEAAVSANATQPAFGSQVQEAWNNSTHSLGEFTVGLLKLGIWLLVYSPYLLVLVAAGYGLICWKRNSQRLVQTPDSSQPDRR